MQTRNDAESPDYRDPTVNQVLLDGIEKETQKTSRIKKYDALFQKRVSLIV